MESKKTDIEILSGPVSVKFDCPHCEAEIEMDFDEFSSLMAESYPGDWQGNKIECPDCEEEIEIDDVDW